MHVSQLPQKVRRFSRLVLELFLVSEGLGEIKPEGRHIIVASVNLFEIAKSLSNRYPLPRAEAEVQEAMDHAKGEDWLSPELGPKLVPVPPMLESERMKELAARALLSPEKVSEAEIQELAAAIISHIAREGR